VSETQQDTTAPRRTRLRGPQNPPQNGAAIRSLREKDGYSQTEFAKAVGMKQGGLSLIETEMRHARLSTLNRIARQLRVPVAAIMRDPDEMNGSAA
jgi:transcriptional regulator with XRE-family HTH domain